MNVCEQMREKTSASASLGLTVLTLEFFKKQTFTLLPAISPEEFLVHSGCSVKIMNKHDGKS